MWMNSSGSSLVTPKYDHEDFTLVLKNRNVQLKGLFSVQALPFPHKQKSLKKLTIVKNID